MPTPEHGESECSICLEALDRSDSSAPILQTLQCGHTFHESCIQKWRRREWRCPMCRHQCSTAEQDDGWTVHESDDGVRYYHNALANESLWEPPASSPLRDNWRLHVDGRDGVTN
eukprot:6036998-Prymnesium_polylepis.1